MSYIIYKYLRKLTIFDITAIVIFVSILTYIIGNFLLRGGYLWNYYFYDYNFYLKDISGGNTYPSLSSHNGPLLYLLYKFIVGSDITLKDGYIMNTQVSMYIFIIWNLTVFILYSFSIQWYLNKHNIKRSYFFTFVFVFSYPFMFILATGNDTLLTSFFTFVALVLIYEKDNRLKFLATLCIIIAANFKFYPCILGILLIKNKEYKLAIIAIILGILVFLTSSFVIGKDTIVNLYKSLTSFDNAGFWAGESNIYYLLKFLLEKIGIADYMVYMKLFRNIILIVSIPMFFLLKDKWKEVFVVTFLCNTIFINNYFYNSIYVLPAFILLLLDMYNVKKINVINSISYICFIIYLTQYNNGAVHFFAMYLIYIIIFVDLLYCLLVKYKKFKTFKSKT